MESVNCNLCGSEDYTLVYSQPDEHFFEDDWFNVVECRNCGLGFVNPRPDRLEMARHYPPTFYNSFAEEKSRHERRYKSEARIIEKHMDKGCGKHLLDVGCANGDFPLYMQKLGWSVEGVEVSRNSRPIAGFKVYTEEFSDIPVCEPRYDLVTAWAVMEHVHDPMSYFRKAAAVLKKGGNFVFLVTNFASISSRRLYREDIPRHLYFFTEENIGRYLAGSGFSLIDADYSNRIYSMRPVNWLRYYLYRHLKGRKLEWRDIPLNRRQYLSERGLENSLGSNLRYAASNPLSLLDRLLMPLFEQYQILSKKYGIVTYIAKKL